MSAYEDYMKAAQLYMDGKTDMNAVEESKQKLYDNFIEVYKAAGNSFENPTDEKKKDAIFCNDTIDGVFKRSIWSMINALNKPSDEKNYADAAAQFAYRAYGFSGDQYNYIVSSIDKQFMEIIKMEMMYQEFIAQRGDYFEEKYPDDESKWESYAAWTNDLNKLNEDVAKAMDTMLDREILVSDSTVGSIRMKLDEFVKPEDMVSVRMKNENYHEKLTGEFYENEQPIIDAFNEGYLYLIEEYGWKSNADVITPFVNFHRIAVPTPKTEENPSGIDIYYIFDTSQPHDAEEDWAWNSDDSVPENLRFYQFEEKIDLTLARDQHIPSCDFINLTKENYSDGQNQFSCAKNTAEFQSLFATGLFSALSSIPGDYLSEYLLTKKDTKTYIALSDYDFDYHDAWATSYTIFHVVDTTGQYPGSSLESSTLSAEKIQPDKSAGAYSAYTVILKNRPQEDGYYKTKVDVATNGVGDTELEMVQEDGTTCQENIVPSGKEVTLRFKAEGTTVLESITLQRHNNTENPSEVTSEETLLTKDQIATLSPDEEGYYTYTYSAPYSNATFKSLFAPDGVVNRVLTGIGLSSVDWFQSTWPARWVIVIALIWRWTGYNMVFYLAGLQNIDYSVYEASYIDGATPFKQFIKITIPLLKPTILMTAIMSTSGTLQLFDESMNLTAGGPGKSTMTLAHYIYNISFVETPKFNYAAALSVCILIMVAILSAIQMKVGDKRD